MLCLDGRGWGAHKQLHRARDMSTTGAAGKAGEKEVLPSPLLGSCDLGDLLLATTGL